MFGTCINKRVVLGVAVAMAALVIAAPRFLGPLAPVLLMAICPVSMLLMMRTTSDRSERSEPGAVDDGAQVQALSDEVRRLEAELGARRQDELA